MAEMFSTKGSMNADSKADAINKLVAFAQALATGDSAPNSPNMSASVSDDAKEALLAKALQSERGRVALAQAMA